MAVHRVGEAVAVAGGQRRASACGAALARAPTWDRLWLAVARQADARGWRVMARECAYHFRALNLPWADQLSEEFAVAACDGDG